MTDNPERRAEDSEKWKNYLDENINWERAFETLGGHFTIRILLRRELYADILEWVEDPINDRHHDLEKILDDCKSARTDMNRSGADPALVNIMSMVIEKLTQLIADKPS